VNERAGVKAGGSNPFASTIPSRVVTVEGILVFWKAALFAELCRNEGLGRSASAQWSPPLHASAPATAGVRRQPRRGTSSAYAQQCVGTHHRHERSSHVLGGRVLRSVLRPVHVDPHYAPREQSPVVGRLRWHHGWANLRKREEPTLGPSRTDEARLAACHRVRKGRGRGTKEKDGGRGLPPCEVPKSSGLVARTSVVVAEVGRRRLASNKLGKRAPKRAAGSSERGSSFSLSSVGETSGGDLRRNDESRVGLHRHSGKGPAQGSGWREIVIQRSQHRSRGAVVAGPGL